VTAVRRRIPELTLIEHEFSVPLDHSAPAGERARQGAILA